MSKNKMSFEEAMISLEKIVSDLEGGALSLDASIERFEEAISLVKLCQSNLEGAKQKVRMLTVGDDGSVTDLPFVEDDEN